jgi:Subtilase family
MRTAFHHLALVVLLSVLGFNAAGGSSTTATNTLFWHKDTERVDADIQSWDLLQLLQHVAADTGWHVLLEPNLSHKVSAKFKDLPAGEALRSLLGNVNFIVVPQTNAPSRLYVFRTSRNQATQLVRAPKPAPKPIPNELLVTLKPGSKTKIDDLARALGAKVIGRMDGQNAYRLQFDSDVAAQAARDQLASNPDVASVDSNYLVDPPPPVQQVNGANVPNLQLDPKPSSGDCQLVVGLIDTPVQPLSSNLQSFLKPALSVAGDVQLPPTQLTHGTAMAETILQAISQKTGGKSSVKIQPVDVYGTNETTTTFDVANGAVTAVNNGADILNMSLGSPSDSSFLQNIISQITQQGVPVFAAAGNTPVTTPTYPAAYPGVVAVTASGANGQIAPYANRGSFIDMMAPGDNVVPFGGQSYLVEGTSTATAIVSGMAAGLADSQGACADQAVSLLRSSSQNLNVQGSSQ